MSQWSRLDQKFAAVVVYGGQTVISSSRRAYESLKRLDDELAREGYTKLRQRHWVKKSGVTITEVRA